MIFGIIGLIICPIICSVVALILGYQAKSEIDASNGIIEGSGKALAGIILGWVGLALGALIVIVSLGTS